VLESVNEAAERFKRAVVTTELNCRNRSTLVETPSR
jgi:hypothetical protein